LFIEFAKEQKNGGEDDDSIQKFKIKLGQLIQLPLKVFSELFAAIYATRRYMLKRKDLKSNLLID
jgi:hypothetical protein